MPSFTYNSINKTKDLLGAFGFLQQEQCFINIPKLLLVPYAPSSIYKLGTHFSLGYERVPVVPIVPCIFYMFANKLLFLFGNDRLVFLIASTRAC